MADQKDGRTTVLVVDDHRAFAEAVALAVGTEPNFHLLGIATTAKDALSSFEADPPDVALVDITLPDADGLDLTAQIKERYPATRVLVITGYHSRARSASALKAGADDFLHKSVPLADLLAALRGQAGQSLERQPDPKATEPATRSPSAEGPELTPRECEVLDLLGQGRPPQRIARDCGISISTCRAHIRAIYRKLDVQSQLAAVAQAARLGLFAREEG